MSGRLAVEWRCLCSQGWNRLGIDWAWHHSVVPNRANCFAGVLGEGFPPPRSALGSSFVFSGLGFRTPFSPPLPR